MQTSNDAVIHHTLKRVHTTADLRERLQLLLFVAPLQVDLTDVGWPRFFVEDPERCDVKSDDRGYQRVLGAFQFHARDVLIMLRINLEMVVDRLPGRCKTTDEFLAAELSKLTDRSGRNFFKTRLVSEIIRQNKADELIRCDMVAWPRDNPPYLLPAE